MSAPASSATSLNDPHLTFGAKAANFSSNFSPVGSLNNTFAAPSEMMAPKERTPSLFEKYYENS